MDKVEELRKWAYAEAKLWAADTATVAEIIAVAKTLEAYVDVSVNPDPKIALKE